MQCYSKLAACREKQQKTILDNLSVKSMGEKIMKKKVVAALLCWFLGVLGAHRFYVGKTGSAIAQLCTFGGCGIWALVDFIMILMGNFTDVDGNPLQ